MVQHPDLTKTNILIIGKAEANLPPLLNLLTRQKYTIRLASDGQSALLEIQAALPDLMLLAINLPDMTGYEFCEQIKANPQTQDIPVLFLVSSNEHFNKAKAFAAGGLDYLNQPFQPEEVLARVSTHLRLAGLQRQLAEQTPPKDQTRELAALYETSLEINRQSNLPALLNLIIRRAAQLLGADLGIFFTVNSRAEKLKMMASYNRPGHWPELEVALGEGVAGRVAQTGELLMIADYDHWEGRLPSVSQRVVGRVLGVPIKQGDEVMGVLSIGHRQTGDYNPNDVQLLNLFAAQAAVAIENTRLLEAERRRTRQLEALQQVSEMLSSLDDSNELLRQIVEAARILSNGDEGVISLYRSKQQALESIFYTGILASAPDNTLFHKRGEGVAGIVWETGRPLIIKDYQQWPHRPPYLDHITGSIIGVPIQWGDKFLGMLAIRRQNPANYFRPEDADLLLQFATQAAIALERASLLEAEHRRVQQLEALHQVSQKLTALQDLDQLLRLIAEQAVLLLGLDTGGIDLYRPELDTLEAMGGPRFSSEQGTFRKQGEGVAGVVWQTGEPVIVDNYQTWPHKPARLANLTGSIIGVPIRWAEKFLGVLSVRSAKPHRHFTPEEVSLLTQFATYAAIAIENARLFEAERHRAEELEALRQISQELMSLHDLDELLHQIVERAIQLLGVPSGGIDLHRPELHALETAVVSGDMPPEKGKLRRKGEGLTGQVWQQGRPVIVDDYQNWPHKMARLELAGTFLGVPIQWGDKFLGVIGVNTTNTQHRFTTEAVLLLSHFADQAAIAIENARLLNVERRRAEQLESLRDMSEKLSALDDLDELLRQIVEAARLLLNSTDGGIDLYRPELDVLETVTVTGYPSFIPGNTPFRKRGEGMAGKVWESGQPLIVKDYQQWPHRLPSLTGHTGSSLSVPIQWGNKFLGVLGVHRANSTHYFRSEDADLLSQFATQAAIALERTRLLEAEHRRVKQLEALHQVSQKLTALQDLDQLLRLIAETARLLLNADDGSVDLYRPEQNRLETVVGIGYRLNELPLIFREPGEGLAGKVWEKGEPVIVNDYQNWPHRPPQLAHVGGSIIGVPIQWGQKFFGVLTIGTSNVKEFTPEDATLLSQFATHAAIAIENARLYDQAQQEISERQKIEEQLNISLEEKVVMLKEIHHRVKNNLQIISSLLDLQLGYIENDQARQMFQESRNRIRSMALIHERLYQSETLARIDFAEYIESLVNYLRQMYKTEGVNMRSNIAPIYLTIEQAIPCGLIINELVSNAMKYAFPPEAAQPGEIYIELQVTEGQHPDVGDELTLLVRDSGVGFPPNIDFRQTKSLGLMLVMTLVRQLEGTIELQSQGGTAFKIAFCQFNNLK